jgi:peptide/nickel transport system substrate-binding protein
MTGFNESRVHGGEAVSRRSLLIGAAASGLFAAVPRSPALAQTPQRSGHLVIGLDGASTADNLDPASYTASYMQSVGLQLYSTLTEIDPAGKVQPGLAESWEAKPGAADWTFKLRRGVAFHNGKTLEAKDVVYSLNHHRDAQSKSGAKAYFSTVTDVQASAPDTVRILLSGGNADIPYLMADYHLCVMPENADPAKGIGTGAFMLDSFEPGVRTLTRRNPNYWRSDRGFVDSVETLAINDQTARTSALTSGSIHIMNRADPRTVDLLLRAADIQLFNIAGGGSYYFVMRCDTAPFDNNDVRLAMKYAIDREAIVKKVLSGYGKIGNDNPIPSFDPYFAADIPQRPYDPEKAKFHMKKSGYDGRIVLSVSDGAFGGAVDTAELFQGSAKKAGIAVDIDRRPSDGYWDDVWMKKPFCASYSGGRATPDLILSLNYKSDAPWNETFWKRSDFDRLLSAARAELDFDKRRSMYHDLQAMLVDQGGALIPMFNNFIDAGAKKVKGFEPTPQIEMSGGRAAERVWLEG